MNQDPTLQDDIRMDVQRESTPLIESNHAPQPQINVCYELFESRSPHTILAGFVSICF